MKFRFFSIFALAGLLLGSCAVDELPTEGGYIVAEMETDQTRTAVTDEGTFTWSKGDQVWLHTTSGSVVGTLSSGAGTSSAKFTYDGFEGETTGKAVYPYNDGHSASGDVLNFVLPASYDLGSSLTNTNAAMYGVNVGGTIKFNHLAGVMRFKFKDVPAGVNKFTITLDKKINGTFSADLTADYPVIEASATSTASEKTITLNFNALTAKSDISIYVPLPIGTYNSLELGLYDDGQAVWTYSKSVTNTVNRKSLKLMPVVTVGGTVDGDLEGLIDYIDEYGVNHGQGVKIDETVWAPVNCGYHETDFKYGKLYQWGRKYGQGYDGSDASVPELVGGPVSLSEGQSQDNGNQFYYCSTEPFSFCNPLNNNLWNSGSEDNPVKTEYDPCPDGWRVPTYTELERLVKNYSSWTSVDSQNGYWFSGASSYKEAESQVFFPAAGERSGVRSKDRDVSSYYWSSSPDTDNDYACCIWCNSSDIYTGWNPRCFGFSVRCVQDDGKLIPVSSMTISETETDLSLGDIETTTLSVTINPSNANHQSAHWWSDDANIATVDQNGNVTAMSVGTTTITAMAGMQVATCKVTVTGKDYVDEYGENHGPGVKIGETIWAPVNCGYHATDFKYGKLYQWGRKYGQGYEGNIYDVNGSNIGTYSDATTPTIKDGGVSSVIGNHKSEENVFYLGMSDNSLDWVDYQDGTLWNSGSETNPVKTEYDPCPTGWRVPTYSELNELRKNHSSWTTKDGQNGYWFSGASTYTESVPQIFFPAAGYLEYYAGSGKSRGLDGEYWSSTPNHEQASHLFLHSRDTYILNDCRAYGYSIRCVQE